VSRFKDPFFWTFVFLGACMVFIVVFGAFIIIRDPGVDCHWRIRNDDRCWKELEEKVDKLEQRVTILEER
jgi:hypothetical protein